MATPINYGDREVSKHRKRVVDDGGDFSPNNAAYVLDKLYPLPKPNLLTMATAGKVGKLYSIYPEDGSGDFTVTRASTASYINEDGKIAIAAINEPRFDFSNGKPVLLTEDAGENLLTHPLTMSDFTQSGATLDDNGGAGYPAPSVDYPTGALKLVATSDNGYIKSPTLTITSGEKYANSFFIKRVKGTGAIYLSDINDTDVDINTLTGHPLANGWMIYDKTEISTSTSGKIGVKLATSGDEVLVAFPQLEENSFASSRMFSGTEGTTSLRSADNIGLSQYSDLPNSDFTMYWEGEFNPINNTDGGSVFMFGRGTNSFGISVYTSGGIRVGIRGTSVKSYIVSTSFNIHYKIAFIYKTTGISYIYVNGILMASGDLTGSGYIVDESKVLSIGGNNVILGATTYSNVSTNSAMIFKRALSEEEAIELTTP